MDARTEHLLALVTDGMTLEEAGRVYGISRERVRQLLKAEGISAKELPGRARKRRSGPPGPARHPGEVIAAVWCQLPPQPAPVIEAMWREGMLYHEIEQVFAISCGDVHRLIRERVPPPERSAHAARRLADSRSSEERHLNGIRSAAGVLADASSLEAEDRRRAPALLDCWLVEHPQPTRAREPPPAPGATPASERLSPADLRAELSEFKAELRAGGGFGSQRSTICLAPRCSCAGSPANYLPGPRRAERPPTIDLRA